MIKYYKQKLPIDTNKIWHEFLDIFIDFKGNNEKIYMNYKIGREKNIEFKEEPIGTFLLEILNNINKIENTIIESKNDIQRKKDIWRHKQRILKHTIKNDNEYTKQKRQLDTEFNTSCIKIVLNLKAKLTRINPKLSILNNFIYQALFDFDRNYSIHFKNSVDRISKKEKFPKRVWYIHLKMLKQLETIHYIEAQMYLQIFSEIQTDLKDIKDLIEKSYFYDKAVKNNKYCGIESNLPICKLEYTTKNVKSPKIVKYTYVLSNVDNTILRDIGLKSLASATIYQLSLSHKIILKCKNCNEYFIPKRTDQVFCIKKCKENYIRKNMSLGKDEEKVKNYYNTLRKRYNNNPTYHEELEKLKNLYQDCKSKQLDDEEIMKILTNFEETVKSTYTVKRGRPPKKKQ